MAPYGTRLQPEREVEPCRATPTDSTPADRAWWGCLWADRIVDSAIARQLVDSGLADTGDLRRISAAWRTWAEAEDGWFSVLHGEILCRVPGRPAMS